MSTAVAAPLTLDGRRLRPGQLPKVVLDAFDGLEAGESVRILTDRPPAGVLAALQTARRGAFEWAPLGEGPQRWETDVHRRAQPVGTLRAVREALAWDHARLDALEEAAFAARAGRRYDDARQTFGWFAHGLRRHIDVEEQILLPEFEARSGLSGENGPSVVMRAEHRAVAAILTVIAGEIADPGAPVELSRAELRALLHDHNLKEEQVIYPALDRLLEPAESDAFVARAQGWTRG